MAHKLSWFSTDNVRVLLPKIKKIPNNTNGRLAIPAPAGLLVFDVNLMHLFFTSSRFSCYQLNFHFICEKTYSYRNVKINLLLASRSRVRLLVNPLTGTLNRRCSTDHYAAIQWLVGLHWSPAHPLLAVPNVTAHPSSASVPTSYYLMRHYTCTIVLAFALYKGLTSYNFLLMLCNKPVANFSMF